MENKPLICKGVILLLTLSVIIFGSVSAFAVVITPVNQTIAVASGDSVEFNRTSTYTGSVIGVNAGGEDTLMWQVTISGSSALEEGMIDLDEVGWVDLLNEPSTDIFHYPLQDNGDDTLVAIGSCDETVDSAGHDDFCFSSIGFGLDANDTFTNTDSILFSYDAPIGEYTITYELVDTATGETMNEPYSIIVNLIHPVTISNTIDFTIGETNFSTALGNSLFRNSVAYYSINSISSVDNLITGAQWKIKIVGPEGSVLDSSMVDLDEVGQKDQNGNNNIEIFHYLFGYELPNELTALGDFFDVDPNDNFTNIDSINFSISAPKGNYTITRQLVLLDEYGNENALSDEFMVAEVTIPGESEAISGAGNETITTNLGLNISLDDLNGAATADLNIIRYDETEIAEDNSLPTSLFGVLGDFYEINSPGLANGDFSVTLTFNYSDTNQNGIVDGTDMPETSLEVMFFNATSDSWEAMNGEVIDADANTVSISTDHFTLFSIVSTFAPSEEAPTTPGGRVGGILTPKTEGQEAPFALSPTPTTETTPIGSNGITGAIIGALGGPKGIAAALVLIVLVVVGIAFFVKAGKSAEKGQRKKK